MALVPFAPELTFLEAPQVSPEQGVVRDSLEGARGQVEQHIAALMAGQVPVVFEGLFREEAQAAPAESPLERYLGNILHISDSCDDSHRTSLFCWFLFCLWLTCFFFLQGAFQLVPFF